jgi:hypothetical protein
MVARTLGDTGHGASQVEVGLLCQKPTVPETQRPILRPSVPSNPDTMYLHQAMKEPDIEQFKEAMIKEVEDQVDNKNFTVVRQDSVVVDEPVMPTVWQMKRKREIITQQVKKWKARLNIDGLKMIKGFTITNYIHLSLPGTQSELC